MSKSRPGCRAEACSRCGYVWAIVYDFLSRFYRAPYEDVFEGSIFLSRLPLRTFLATHVYCHCHVHHRNQWFKEEKSKGLHAHTHTHTRSGRLCKVVGLPDPVLRQVFTSVGLRFYRSLPRASVRFVTIYSLPFFLLLPSCLLGVGVCCWRKKTDLQLCKQIDLTEIASYVSKNCEWVIRGDIETCEIHYIIHLGHVWDTMYSSFRFKPSHPI